MALFEIYVIRPGIKAGPPIFLCGYETSREAEEHKKYLEGKYTRLTFLIKNNITKGMADSFYRDCVGTLNKGREPYASYDLDYIAERMGISEDRASDLLWACADYKITERQGGSWVI